LVLIARAGSWPGCDGSVYWAAWGQLVKQGAAAILVGCTEFSLISGQIKTTVSIVDALDVLVAATLNFAGVRPDDPA